MPGIEIGASIGLSAGTSVFAELGGPLSALSGTTLVCATAAIIVAVVRYNLKPDDENAIASATRIRRVLTVASFLAASGAFFTWLITGTASDPVPGLDQISGWFG